VEIRHLAPTDIGLISQIDRSEHVTYAYRLVGGEMEAYDVDWRVPNWDPVGTGEHSVAGQLAFWRPRVDAGARLVGAFSDEDLLALEIVVPGFEPGLAWLAFLHVSRSHRRAGVGSALWEVAVELGRHAGATRMYVSATPSGPTVDFYLAMGCRLAPEPHPALFDLEPEDIHLICSL
jgi:GNAT superfamily N-acetyltransferase